MLYYLHSSDPSSYSTIKVSTASLLGYETLKFRIKQLSTVAAFLVTTEDDFMTFNINNAPVTVHFKNKSSYRYDLENELAAILPAGITCEFNDELTLTFKSTSVFTIQDASHRAKLLTGLYHTELPLTGTEIKVSSIPMTCYGDNLFLQSRISSIVGVSSSDRQVSFMSICYNVSEIFIPGIPIMSKQPGTFTKISPNDLSNLEFVLVDFMNEPVILKAPLFITMELVRENEFSA